MDCYNKKKKAIADSRNTLIDKNSIYYIKGGFELFIVIVLGSFSSIALQNGLLFFLTILVAVGVVGFNGRMISINKKKLLNLKKYENELENDKDKQDKVEIVRNKINNMSLTQLNSLKNLIMNYDLIDLVNDIIKYDCAELLFPDNIDKNEASAKKNTISPFFDYQETDIGIDDVKLVDVSYELNDDTLRRLRKRDSLVRYDYYKREK